MAAIAEEFSTTADVSSSIFLQESNSAGGGGSVENQRNNELEEEPSSTVFIEDIAEDEVFSSDNGNNGTNGTTATKKQETKTASTGEAAEKAESASAEDNTATTVIDLDPLCESYRNIISLINRTSQGFKEGKKWKCNSTCKRGQRGRYFQSNNPAYFAKHRTKGGKGGSSGNNRELCRCRRQCSQCNSELEMMLSHSNTIDSGDGLHRGRMRGKPLVRQLATSDDDNTEEGRTGSNRRLKVSGRMPSRQWTTDASMSNDGTLTLAKANPSSSPMVMSSTNSAFLLRPVSRNSVLSGGPTSASASGGGAITSALGAGGAASSSMLPQPEFDSKSPATRAAINAAVAAASGRPANLPTSGEVSLRSAPNGAVSLTQTRHILRKQRTSESAPSPRFGAGADAQQLGSVQILGGTAAGGGPVTIRQLPRQHSNASAYSMAMPVSYSHQGITLIRGASCSLVDIPTYLGHTLHSGGGVEVAQIAQSQHQHPQIPQIPHGHVHQPAGVVPSAPGERKLGPGGRAGGGGRPRLQLDLTRKKNSAKSTRKTKWTVLCVSLTLLTMCVTLVGTMLSLGSQYQGTMVAREWDDLMLVNRTASHHGSATTFSPLMNILKIPQEKEGGGGLFDRDFEDNEIGDGLGQDRVRKRKSVRRMHRAPNELHSERSVSSQRLRNHVMWRSLIRGRTLRGWYW